MCALRDELDALPAATPVRTPMSEPPSETLDAILGGAECVHDGCPCWEIRTAVPPTVAKTSGAVRLLVVDIETGGFSGSPVFLIGALEVDAVRAHIVQFLARDYPEEVGILRAFAALADSCGVWVTFNGKSFDHPFLRDRATRHRMSLPEPPSHIDLLPLARRKWRGVTPDCKLATLERHILGRARLDDIPGSDVPDLFHHFIRTGNARPLRAVLEHNRLDLLASYELFGHLGVPDCGQ